MESVLGRYRNLVILVGVLFLQVLGLAMQVKRGADAENNTRLIRIWAVEAITPLERGLVWMQNGASNLWHNYFYLRGVRAENRQLKEEIEHMKLEQVRLNEDATQAHRLQALLAFKEQYISKTVPAQVIGSSGSDLSRSIYIDKGSDEGIQPDMAVITASGIVGKVLHAYPSTSLVLLINDQSSGVGVILEKSRLQGVLRGTANGEVQLERVMSDEQVPGGEAVLTSGGDQIFPKGLTVGTVAKVEGGKDLFLNIKVKPAADLSRLEEVLVVLQKQERQATAQETVRVRAADILAQRLPSVPDKPATDANNGTAVPSGTAEARPGAGAAAGSKNTAQPKPQSGGDPNSPVAIAPVRTEPTFKPVTPAGSTGSSRTGSNSIDKGGTKSSGGEPTAPTASAQSPGAKGSHSAPIAGQAAAPGAVKTGVQKEVPEKIQKNASPDSPAATVRSGSRSSGPKPAGSPTKPANTQAKPAPPPVLPAQPNPQPPSVDDGPH
jgi:rod shape-determining protein MreC